MTSQDHEMEQEPGPPPARCLVCHKYECVCEPDWDYRPRERCVHTDALETFESWEEGQ